MDKPIQHYSINGHVKTHVKTVESLQAAGALLDERRFTTFARIVDATPSQRSTIPYIVPSAAMTQMFAKVFSDEAAEPSPETEREAEIQAQAPAATPAIEPVKDPWKPQVNSARIAWGKLSHEELMNCEGDEEKLAGLLQKRYSISRENADQQVKSFFERLKA